MQLCDSSGAPIIYRLACEARLDLVGVCVPALVAAAAVDALAVESKQSVQEHSNTGRRQCGGTQPAEPAWAKRQPQPCGEHDEQDSRQVGGDLVVEPGIVGGESPQVRDVIASGTEARRLRVIAGEPADVERD